MIALKIVGMAAVYILIALMFWGCFRFTAFRFSRPPKGPDYSDEPQEKQQARSHIAWHDWKKIPPGGDCEWCKRFAKDVEAMERWLEHGRTRTP